jgi:hypothetical protein
MCHDMDHSICADEAVNRNFSTVRKRSANAAARPIDPMPEAGEHMGVPPIAKDTNDTAEAVLPNVIFPTTPFSRRP